MCSDLSLYRARYWYSSYREWPVYPFCWEEAIRRNKICFSGMNSPYMLINLILDGNIIYEISDGRCFQLSQGDLLVIPEHSNYQFSTTSVPYYHKIVLELKGTILQNISEELCLMQPVCIKRENAETLHDNIMELGRRFFDGEESDVPDLLGMTWKILTQISAQAGEESEEQKLMALARSHLEHNVSGKFTVALLAKKLGISHSTLTSRFRAHYGVSPQQYRINYRKQQATYLLANTSMVIKEIACRLGYANQLYFSNDFKKYSGMSPKKFREIHFH